MNNQALPVAVGVIKNAQQEVLLALRAHHQHQGGLWEFPGGKIAAQETPLQALKRELHEELALEVLEAKPLITLQHDYPDVSVQLHVFEVTKYSGNARGCEGQTICWVALDKLRDLPFPAANQAIITAARLPAYYAILDDATILTPPQAAHSSALECLLTGLQQLLAQNLPLIQLRLKTLPPAISRQFLHHAQSLCTQAKTTVLLNSALPWQNLAINGLHLTSTDLMRCSQRPPDLDWLAASCHNAEQLRHAHAIGADFAVLAPVQATLTHPHAPILGWSGFAKLTLAAKLPVYALGGVLQTDLAQAKMAGAQGLAGIRLFFQ